MNSRFSILTVCTGNICRSPLAQQILAQQLADIPEVEVSSAGVRAMVDHPMPAYSLEIAQANGVVDAQAHRARQLTTTLIDASSLILAMDRTHRTAIVELSPKSVKRVFTVRDFGRLCSVTTDAHIVAELQGSSTVDKLQAAVVAATLSRSDLLPLENATDEDVIDPFGQAQSMYHQSAAQLLPALHTIAEFFKRAVVVEP